MSVDMQLCERAQAGCFDHYASLCDEDVVDLVHRGQNDALDYLLYKYKNFVRAKARSYFLVGADREDIIQEGMIGFFKAVRDFRREKQAYFYAFAELCVTRQIITAVKTATRQKHIPLNSYVSLNKPIYDDDSERMLIDVVGCAVVSSPEELLIEDERRSYLEAKMNETLSKLELEVLHSYLQDKSYREIAGDLQRHVKSVDNALQRVKRKMGKLVQQAGAE